LSTLIVPSRFNGPPASGNGGYSCGVIAARFDGACAVSLRRPVPLDQPLELEAGNGLGSGIAVDAGNSGVLRVTADGELIAKAVAAPELAPWSGPAVDLEAARDATSRFVPPANGFFDHCFVCGRDRHDGLCVFAGPIARSNVPASSQLSSHSDERCELGRVVASTWTPPEIALERSGRKGSSATAILDAHGEVLAHAELVVVEPRSRGDVT
jgi:hypothetical protein